MLPRIATLLQVPKLLQLTDDPLADLLDHLGKVGIGRRLSLEKVRREPLGGAIEIDPLEDDEVEREIQIDGTAKAACWGVHSRERCGKIAFAFPIGGEFDYASAGKLVPRARIEGRRVDTNVLTGMDTPGSTAPLDRRSGAGDEYGARYRGRADSAP